MIRNDQITTESETWDLFISHASEDKETVARPLAKLLRAQGVSVWLDENELKLGDSLRQKIDAGLANCRYGVVIISQAFFAKQWPQRELNGLLAREEIGGKVVLPVWHGVDAALVSRFSPILADRLAGNTAKGLDSVVALIQSVVADRSGTAFAVNPPRDADDIHGKWDQRRAEGVVRRKLAEAEAALRSPAYDSDQLPLVHTILGEYNLRYRDRESIVVVTASIEKGVECHACAPNLSLFEFERSKFGWAFIDSAMAVTQWGQWGKVSADEVKVFTIGDNIYGLFLDIAGGNQGFIVTVTSVQARIGDYYKEILRLRTSADDSGSMEPGQEKWDSVIKPQPGGTGFYDLVVERQGIRDGKTFTESERFKFNGQKYASARVYG